MSSLSVSRVCTVNTVAFVGLKLILSHVEGEEAERSFPPALTLSSDPLVDCRRSPCDFILGRKSNTRWPIRTSRPGPCFSHFAPKPSGSACFCCAWLSTDVFSLQYHFNHDITPQFGNRPAHCGCARQERANYHSADSFLLMRATV